MIGPSRLILTKRADSKTNYSNFLCGLSLLLIWVVLSSCESTPPKRVPGQDKMIIKRDLPELAKAKEAQRKAEDAMKDARRAQDALLSLQPMRQTAQQRPQDRDQKTEDASQPASLPPDRAEKVHKLVEQAMQSPHRLEELAQKAKSQADKAKQEAENASRTAQQDKQTAIQAETSAEKAKNLFEQAESETQKARTSVQNSLELGEEARDLADEALQLVKQSQKPAQKAEEIAQRARQIAGAAEEKARKVLESDNQMQELVETAKIANKQAQDSFDQAKNKAEMSERAAKQAQDSAEKARDTIKYFKVPKLVGLNLEKAENRLRKLKLNFDITKVPTKTKNGTVCYQDPTPGPKKIKVDTPVTLKVACSVKSKKRRRPVPDVEGRSLEEAKKILYDNEFSWQVEYNRKRNKPAKKVYKQIPEHPTKIKLFTPVTLKVAYGQKPPKRQKVEVPRVTEISLPDALEQLWESDLSWIVEEKVIKNKSGTVLKQDPLPKVLRPADNTVKLEVAE